MTHTSCIGATATVTMAGSGITTVSHSHSNAFTCGRCSLRLQTVLLQHARDGRRNLHAEEKGTEKRRKPLFFSTSHSWEQRLGKTRRQVCVSASSLDWAVSNKSHPSDTIITPYVVQDGDTLTSIAKKTKTSVRLLADVNRIEYVDFLLSGQLLQIPTKSEVNEMPARPAVGADEFPVARVYDARSSSRKSVPQQESTSSRTGVKALKSEGSRLAASVQPALSFNLPKLAVPILLIAPLLGFSIRCIVDALYLRMDREEATELAERDAWETLHSPKTKRWQTILEEDRDGVETSSPSPDAPTPGNAWAGGDVWTQDANARSQDADVLEKTRESITNETDEEIGLRHKQDYEEIRKSYVELESVYVKFLSDSGMSKSGYWRGSGVGTTARLDDGEPR